ncbi:MAG: TolC family protein [Fibrobacteres bacterium]|nr:TolC family protein [Fibrobacterota bacterium]
MPFRLYFLGHMIRTALQSALPILTLAGLAIGTARAQGPLLSDKPSGNPSGKLQPLLTLDEAIRLAMENNYSLSLARDESALAENARRGGFGNFLPSANAGISRTGALDGTASTTRISASADWLVFNGFRNYNGYRRLESQERAAELQERQSLESLLETVVVSYYDLVQQKQRLAAIDDLLAVSQERARLANAKLEVGAGSKLEQLQSLSDLNEDSSTYLNQAVSLGQAKVRLNQQLARDPALDFEVADSIPLEPSLPLEDWRKGLSANNSEVAAARAQKTAAAAGVAEARGGWLPNLTTGVTYSNTPEALNSANVGAGRSGFVYNIGLSVPLFDRLATPTGVRRARIGLRQGETRLRQTELAVESDFEVARRQYETSLRRMSLEERNLLVARRQAEAAQERYKLGASSPLEFRDAQTRLLDAEGRLISARQSAKQSEAALQRLAGVLVKRAPAENGADAGGQAGPETHGDPPGGK